MMEIFQLKKEQTKSVGLHLFLYLHAYLRAHLRAGRKQDSAPIRPQPPNGDPRRAAIRTGFVSKRMKL